MRNEREGRHMDFPTSNHWEIKAIYLINTLYIYFYIFIFFRLRFHPFTKCPIAMFKLIHQVTERVKELNGCV